MENVRRYRVLVEYDDGDSWDKQFRDAHEALEYYRGCSNVRMSFYDKATVKAQRLDDGEWTTVFKSTTYGRIWG